MDGSRSAALETPEEDSGYFKALATCGDSRPLLVSQPIYSANGIKLLDTGAKIDSRILDRLFGHKLAEPIDRCVTSPDAVRPADLVAAAREQVEASPLLAHFHVCLGERAERLWSALGSCPLPPAIALRLTVARDTAAGIFQHLLRSAFLALFIGSGARPGDGDQQTLATAALLHDIGMLHTDPVGAEPERPLDTAARRRLFAHPLTGELIARREPLLSAAVATAIAQHHERLDGTGYPRGLNEESISYFGRVLMLVEVTLAILEGQSEQPALQLSLVLRLNHHSFDRKLSGALLAALPRVALDDGETQGKCAEYEKVTERIDAWLGAHGRGVAVPGDPGVDFIGTRLLRLRRWLADAGLGDP